MTKQNSITNNPLLDALIADYQSNYFSEMTWSDAATRLLVRGIVAWIEEDDCDTQGRAAVDGIKPSSVTKLLNEYALWHTDQMRRFGWTSYDEMTASEQRSVSLHSYLADKIVPKRGGKREGAGRKKVAATNDQQ